MLYEKKQDYAALLPKLNHHISYCDDVPLSFQSVFQSLDQEHWLTEDRSCSCQSNLVCIISQYGTETHPLLESITP